MIRLKLAAMSLGITNNVFTFDAEKEKQMISEIKKYSQDEQLLVMSCYMKQKTVTYAIAILFPYLRAIVSTYTANANVVPVILPAMNINAYMRKKYQNGEKQV